jgi:hypothetical protein
MRPNAVLPINVINAHPEGKRRADRLLGGASIVDHRTWSS